MILLIFFMSNRGLKVLQNLYEEKGGNKNEAKGGNKNEAKGGNKNEAKGNTLFSSFVGSVFIVLVFSNVSISVCRPLSDSL